jgi:hypothetical protein
MGSLYLPGNPVTAVVLGDKIKGTLCIKERDEFSWSREQKLAIFMKTDKYAGFIKTGGRTDRVI